MSNAKWILKRRGRFYYYTLEDKTRIFFTSETYKTKDAAYRGIGKLKRLIMEAGLDDSWGEIKDE